MRINPFSGGPQPPPQNRTHQILMAASGASLGGAAGVYAGSVLGPQYGPQLVNRALPQALRLVQNGWMTGGEALRALHWASQPATQAQLGAMSLGFLGAAVGAAVAVSLLEMGRA